MKPAEAMGIYKHDGGAFSSRQTVRWARPALPSDMIQRKIPELSRVLEAKPLTKEQLQKLGERCDL